VSSETKKKWMQPGFLIAVAILAVAAIGLNTALSALRLTLEKDPVPLAQYGKTLDTIPKQLGPWVQVSEDAPIDKEIEDALATKEYVFRDYVDSRIISAEELKRFDGKSVKDRQLQLAEIQAAHPEAVMNCAVTYYTGGHDTVAHIPDRCYIADGFEPSSYETPQWNLGGEHLGDHPKDPLSVRFITFEDQTRAGRITRHVAYCFFTDGVYSCDPLEVRKTLATLWYKHGFYSKIELMSLLNNHDQAESVMRDFLSSALPSIEQCMPDWKKVEGK